MIRGKEQDSRRSSVNSVDQLSLRYVGTLKLYGFARLDSTFSTSLLDNVT